MPTAYFATHESVHATDKKNQLDTYSNKRQGTDLDTESVPDNKEIQYLKEVAPIKPLELKKCKKYLYEKLFHSNAVYKFNYILAFKKLFSVESKY